MLSERERLARDEFNDTQNEMQAWLEEIEAERVDVHYDGVGLLGRIRFWLTEDGEKKLVDEPDQEVRNFVESLSPCFIVSQPKIETHATRRLFSATLHAFYNGIEGL